MSEPFTPAILQPGDAILYFSHDFGSWLIALKTWTKVAHIEFTGAIKSAIPAASESGVNAYPLRLDGVAAVMRPKSRLISSRLTLGLKPTRRATPMTGVAFFALRSPAGEGRSTPIFCSEFGTHYYRAAGLEPFNPRWPAVRVPPSFFLVSPAFEKIWTDRDWF